MSVPPTPIRRATPTERWSLVNALGMLVATGAAIALDRPWPLLTGLGFLGGLVVLDRRSRTTNGFGWANTVTALRTIMLGLFPVLASRPPAIIALSLLFILADSLDGWLARLTRSTSTFGAFFDKEADALFVLLLCTTAVLSGRLPPWMIGVGLLRYTFVIVVFLLAPPKKTEARSSWARYIHGTMVGALLLVFLAPAVFRPCAYIAAAALIASFGNSLRQIIHPAALHTQA